MKKLVTLIIASYSSIICFAQNAPTPSPRLLGDIPVVPAVTSKVPDKDKLSKKDYFELTTLLSDLQEDQDEQLANSTDNLALSTELDYFLYQANIKKDGPTLARLTSNRKILISNSNTIKKNRSIIKDDIATINRTINDRMETDKATRDFRRVVSITFSVLIGIIIIGFFVVILLSKSAAVYSNLLGREGLQFITLFSIIIAIVLFGVLDILEGKELAAIISGISGFILGKYDSGKDTRPSQPNATEQQV